MLVYQIDSDRWYTKPAQTNFYQKDIKLNTALEVASIL